MHFVLSPELHVKNMLVLLFEFGEEEHRKNNNISRLIQVIQGC